MDLSIVPTKELVRELLLREPKGSIRIEVGRIMQIESYYPGTWVGPVLKLKPIQFRIAAESHEEQTFADVDEAVEAFYRWNKRGNDTRDKGNP